MVYVMDALDKKCCSFLYSDEENKKKVHTVYWHEVCLPKDCGSLGLRSSLDMNIALMVV